MSERRHSFLEICALPASAHEALFLGGIAPLLSDLAGWEFRGMNGGPMAPLLGIRRFIKGFRAPDDGRADPSVIDGYNLWAKQARSPKEPWIATDRWFPRLREPDPSARIPRHGFYKVLPQRSRPNDRRYPHALLLDYGLGDNPWSNPARLLRDYLVQVYADDPSLLVGKAYVALGRARIFGSHFVLERMRRAR